MNITVYLGAKEGNDPGLKKAVQELGTWMGSSGNALVYGGSKSGLMGAIADSVLAAGGEVTGVEPEFFIQDEFQHAGLTKLIVTKDMPERKSKNDRAGRCFSRVPRRHGDVGGNYGGYVQGFPEAPECAVHSLQSERLL